MTNRGLAIMVVACLMSTHIMAMKRKCTVKTVNDRNTKRKIYVGELHNIMERKEKLKIENNYQYRLWAYIVSGANVNETDRFGRPFIFNLMRDTTGGLRNEDEKNEFLELAIQHGLNLEATLPENGIRILHYCAGTNNSGAVGRLVRSGANVNAIDDFGRIPLHYVDIFDENKKTQANDIAKILVNAGADVNKRDIDGYTPLYY